jgi:hypothetical protein
LKGTFQKGTLRKDLRGSSRGASRRPFGTASRGRLREGLEGEFKGKYKAELAMRL